MTDESNQIQPYQDLNIYQRINKVMQEVPYLQKDTSVGFGNNEYSALSHDYVAMKLNPILVKYGIVVIPSVKKVETSNYKVITNRGSEVDRYQVNLTCSVSFINSDRPEERFSVESFAMGFDNQDKAPGKAYSMAVKYALLKTFVITSGDQEEQRVEAATLISNERSQLEDKLKSLLRRAGKLTEKSLNFIPSMDINTLRLKISEYESNEAKYDQVTSDE